MARTTTEQLNALLAPVVTAAGYDLEGVEVSAAGRRSVVRVVIDRDGGLDLDAVAEVSRAISEALDGADAFGDSSYVLEVTSPGVDRPLTEPRHWRRNVGRLVRTQSLTGRIVEVTDDGVVIAVNGAAETVSFTDLGTGHVEIEFSR